MDILEKIVAQKRKEVARQRERYPIKLLEESLSFGAPVVSLREYLKRPDKVGIIAEFKRRSPSKGSINAGVSVEKVSIGYMQAGASALSVLTDEEFFGGSSDDLCVARRFNFCPILRKDFIIDEYQIVEARSLGADAILLIAACLTPEEIKSFAAKAAELELEVLLEVHSQEELDRSFTENIHLVGVNNRDLKTFQVSLDTSLGLIGSMPDGVVAVAESGINSPEDVQKLRVAGFQGFLIGEAFMREARPEEACAAFIRALRRTDGEEVRSA